MAGRLWTTTEARRAEDMRWSGMTYAQIGRELERTPHSVSDFLLKRGKTGTRKAVERQKMLRRALPLHQSGMSITSVMREVGWTASKQAMWQALRAYARRIGPEAA